MLLGILLVGFLVTSDATTDKRIAFPPDLLLPLSNGNATGIYNIYSEKCCLGKISPHTSREDKCCGSSIYNPTQQTCCNEAVFTLKLGYACCGSTTYDTTKQICCDNRVINVTKDADKPYVQCCFGNSYDVRNQACCANNLKWQVVSAKTPYSSCCGLKAYDQNTELCCFNAQTKALTVHPKKYASSQCCNDEVIDTHTQGCCNNTVFNLNQKACCYNKVPFTLIDIKEKGEQCCGKTAYTPGKQQCCGDKLYDDVKELCCYSVNGSNVVKKDRPDQTGCCGIKPYDFNAESCCYDRTGNTQVYKMDSDTCCGGKVYSETGICCGAETGQETFIKTKDRKNYICCGAKAAYNVLTQVCCDSTVYEKKGKDSLTCCGNKTYDYNTEMCCSKFEYETVRSTGEYAVLQKQEGKFCCGLKLITYDSETSCCGNEVYKVNQEMCCGDKIFKKENGKDQCCYQRMTDERSPCWMYPMLKDGPATK